jgi:cytoskeletal protein CcmA (bactofilin family)
MAAEQNQSNQTQGGGDQRNTTSAPGGDSGGGNSRGQAGSSGADSDSPSKLKKLWGRLPFIGSKKWFLNPYIWAFLVVLALMAGIIWYVQSNNQATNIDGEDFPAASIDEEDFASLSEEQAEIDNTNKSLNVQANSVFDGTMLVRSSLEVQGQLRVGQKLALKDIAASGQATLNNVDVAESLNVGGNTQLNTATVQGGLSVNEDLTVAGGGTFAGTLNAQAIETGSLSFSGDLTMNGKLITGGAQTGASPGGSIGSGGTVSVSGNGTAGTVNVNTGGSPSRGTLVNVQFGSNYPNTPRVNVTPVGSDTGSLDWYVTRTASGFTIGSDSAPAGGTNYTFDYFIAR